MRALAVCIVVLSSIQIAAAQELLGPDKMFLRFTNLRDDEAKVLLRVNVVPNHDKWFGWNGMTVYVDREGARETDDAPMESWLAPREPSPWIDVGQYMNRRGTRSPDAYLSPVLCGVRTDGGADGIHLLVEVAQGRGTAVLRRLEVHRPEVRADDERSFPWKLGFGVWNHGAVLPTVGLLIPTRPEIAPRVYTLEEALRWQLDVIEEFPDVGRVPERYVFVARGHDVVKQALGYRGYPEGTVEGNLGDEIAIHLTLPEDEQNRRFRESLKARGFDPLELIPDQKRSEAESLPPDERWSLVTVEPLPDKPKQFYESANFRYQLWYEELAAQRREIEEKNPGKRVIAGANFSPHMNVWPDVRQWVGPFKSGAMTMTWTEDWWWQLPEISPQGYGFLLDGLRLAGGYHGAPMQFYIMPFQGNSPDNVRRMHGLAVAHGATIFNHFVIEDQTLITWDYIDTVLSPPMFQAIHDVIRGLGAVERRFYDAKPRKAEVAILLSRAADTWDTEDLGGAGHLYSAQYNVNNEERKAIWLALRHAQVPVDLITDEDVAEGKLTDYKVLYIVGSEMLGAAVEPLTRWVNDGGVLYGTAGGGALDEYRQPSALRELYGLASHDLHRESRHIRPRTMLRGTTSAPPVVEGAAVPEAVANTGDAAQDATQPLPQARIQPLDVLTIQEPESERVLRLPALLYRATVAPAEGATVLGTYADGGAAGATLVRRGKGAAIYVGVLAGLAYEQPAATESSQVLPTQFPAAVRDFIAAPVRMAGVRPPVQASDPLVETQLMEGPQGRGVVLINWRDAPAEKVTVRFPGVEARRVRSLTAALPFKGHLDESARGELPVEEVDGVPQVTLDVATIDFLLLD